MVAGMTLRRCRDCGLAWFPRSAYQVGHSIQQQYLEDETSPTEYYRLIEPYDQQTFTIRMERIIRNDGAHLRAGPRYRMQCRDISPCSSAGRVDAGRGRTESSGGPLLGRLLQIKPAEHVMYFTKQSLVLAVEAARFRDPSVERWGRRRSIAGMQYSTTFSQVGRKLVRMLDIPGIRAVVEESLFRLFRDELLLTAHRPSGF